LGQQGEHIGEHEIRNDCRDVGEPGRSLYLLARALQLPLVGGGDHDWNTILSRWRLLAYDAQIAGIVKTVGWIGIVAASVWGAWRGWLDRKGAEVTSEFPKWD
jgi:hypothetical protein